MELLAMLVNAELQVLFTTHSPYMIDHLTNLMKASKSKNKVALKDKFYLKNEEAFISQDKVSVYLFQDGTTKNILREDGLVDWDTFSKVTDEINNLYYEIE
jgi:hypothetical protein